LAEIKYTLVSDGPSNRALLPLLTWLLSKHLRDRAIQFEWADLRKLHKPPARLADKIKAALDLYPCDLLFVHRDAENENPQNRYREIGQALEEVENDIQIPPSICVVPVRMMEAWLLFDKNAVRKAAGNPQGSLSLALPNLNNLEQLPDPKAILHNLLRAASGLSGRRLKDFTNRYLGLAVHRVPDYIEDFTPLRGLPAFNRLENDLQDIITSQGWESP